MSAKSTTAAVRILRAWSRVFFVITVCCVIGAWYIVWSDHRREVARERFVWGQNADVPIFNPLKLLNFVNMSDQAIVAYGLAALTGVLGCLCWLGGRKLASVNRNAQTSS